MLLASCLMSLWVLNYVTFFFGMSICPCRTNGRTNLLRLNILFLFDAGFACAFGQVQYKLTTVFADAISLL